MATEITVRSTIGDRPLMVSAPPKAIGRMIENRTGGRLAELFEKIVDDRLDLTEVMAILRVFERDAEVLEYLKKLIAADGEAEAAAREAAAVLVMIGVAGGNASG